MTDLKQTVAELEQRLQASLAECDDLLQQRAATNEVLQVINASSGDLAPVFDAILERAMRLCEAEFGLLATYDGGQIRTVATRGVPSAFAEFRKNNPPDYGPGTGPARILAGERVVHIADLKSGDAYRAGDPNRRAVVDLGGARTVLLVPLLKNKSVLGYITIYRKEVRPYSDKHIVLLQDFANQAMIAIENARLFKEAQDSTAEVTEALERQTATSEILRVISQSPTDVQPVFDAIVQTAVRLIRCDIAFVFRCDGATFSPAAAAGPDGPLPDLGPSHLPIDPSANFPSRAIVGKQNVHLPDWSLIDVPEHERQIQALIGVNSALFLPLLRQTECIGVLALAGKQASIFGESEIALAESFRDQALIAIENVRLFNETREALERQTATADILKVISSSVADTTPVFEQILDSCERLAAFNRMAIFLLDEDGQVHIGAYRGGEGDALDALKATFPQPLANTPMSLAFDSQQALFFGDVLNNPDAPESLRIAASRMGSFSVLVAPLLWEGRGIGAFHVARDADATFSDREVALLKTFADQAAIAIQNARLFNETREALEQQKVSADILAVISSSVADAQPVFDKILASCKHLFGGDELDVLLMDEQGQLNIAAYIGDSHDVVAATFPAPVERTPAGRAIRERRVMHWPDLVDGEDVPGVLRKMAKLIGYRSMVFAPMLWEGRGIGAIGVARSTGPFKPKELAMIQTFADQAVIAIQNARLFNETQEALERQTATADILKVIASSPDDVQPVFEAIAERANKLVGGYASTVLRMAGDVMELAAFTPVSREADELLVASFPLPISGNPHYERLRRGEIAEAADTELAHDALKKIARARGFRSRLAVPLTSDSGVIGAISVTRREPGAFAAHHVQLLQTFADQAVIAIQNVRLFNETKEALARQTATSDVLKVIASSPGDLSPVFDKMLENATRVCGAEFGSMILFEGDMLRQVALYNAPPAFAAQRMNKAFRIHPRSSLAHAIHGKQVVQVEDMRLHPAYIERNPSSVELTELAGARTIVVVPMLRQGEVIGVITVYRQEVRPFNDKQIELLNNFASQAVIAIENTRLLRELRERTDALSRSLNDLHAAQDRLVQTEKLASLGQLTAGIAHEIKNPLNFVNNFSALSAELVNELDETLVPAPLDQKMRDDVGELTAMLKSNLEKVVTHGKRADSIVRNMLLHSREGSGERRPADINVLVGESLNLAYHGARAEKPGFAITLKHNFDPAAGTLELYPQEITRALLNLISNGFYAAAMRKAENADGAFEPVLSAATRNLGDTVEIRIRDNGTGIPPGVRQKMFNPFFTTKPTGEGTGLGLSMTHDIVVKQHGGRIDVETEPGAFTEFVITLPRDYSAAVGLKSE